MKQVKFKGTINGKKINGSWFCENRPMNAKIIAERLVGSRIDNFISFCTDKKIQMIKCEEVIDEQK